MRTTAQSALPPSAAAAADGGRWPETAARTAALLAGGMATAVLLGWALGIAPLTSLLPGWPAMSTLTASMILLLGVALLKPAWTTPCAGVVALTSGLRLAAHVVGWNLGIDTLGLPDPRGPGAAPASMSVGTALTLLLLAAALLVVHRSAQGGRGQLLVLLALLIAWLGLSRYLFGGEPLVPIARMALQTALSLFLLGLAALCRMPGESLVRLLSSSSPGGAIARRLLAPALLFPPLAGWLRLQGTEAGWFGAEAGLSLFTAALGMAFGALVWTSARLLDRAEAGRRLATERVLASQQQLQAIVESALDAVITVDRHGIVSSWSASAAAIFGWPAAQALGQPMEQLIVPVALRDAHRRGMARYLATGHGTLLNRRIEMTALHRDGHEFPVDLTMSAIGSGETLQFSAFLRDISERKRAEAALGRLAAIVESSEDAIISKDPDGRITSWNGGAERFYGHREHDVLGRPALILVPERLAEEETRQLAAVCSGNRAVHFETVRRRRDGSEVDVSVQLSPIFDAAGTLVAVSSITRDMTELKRHAAELQRSNSELEQFAYVASHDLQEPLRMVANYTELLAKRYQGQLDEKADRYIHYASDGARRMQRLVSDLLAFSRVGSQGQPLVRVSSQQTLEAVVVGLQRIVRDTGATIESAELPMVLADPGQLHQLLQNLISNAIKFRGEAPPHIVVGAVRSGPQWQFSMADNGIGLEMRYAERIFQMFQRLHELGRYEGSGIGLAIAKRIVERHGGRMWVESEPGRGTTFHFTLADAAGEAP